MRERRTAFSAEIRQYQRDFGFMNWVPRPPEPRRERHYDSYGERHEERARTRSQRLPHASYPDTSKSSSGELYYMHHQRSCAVDAGGTCAPSSGRSDDLGESSVRERDVVKLDGLHAHTRAGQPGSPRARGVGLGPVSLDALDCS